MIAATGCDRAFGIEDVPPPPDVPPQIANYDRCSPIPDDPLRYATVSAPVVGAWSWDDARTACMRRGMDLAVMNDEHELSMSQTEVWPYWVGAAFDGNAWSSVDGCPAYSRTQVTGATAQCGFAGDSSGTIIGAPCNGALADAPVDTALCESPRPSTGACGFRKPADEQYVLSDEAFTYANARQYCQKLGGHLLVIDSVDELHFVSQLAHDQAYPRLWIGATFDHRTWQSDTSCPGLYSWTDGTPTFGTSTDCLATTMAADPEEPTIQRMTGMRPARCTEDGVRALCELGDLPIE